MFQLWRIRFARVGLHPRSQPHERSDITGTMLGSGGGRWPHCRDNRWFYRRDETPQPVLQARRYLRIEASNERGNELCKYIKECLMKLIHSSDLQIGKAFG